MARPPPSQSASAANYSSRLLRRARADSRSRAVYDESIPEWEIRQATLADRDGALALLERAYGDEDGGVPGSVWDWIFVRNPHTSDLFYLVADTGSRLAAQCAAMPVAMLHQGRPITGLITVHTATDPDFRRRGLFRTLALQLYEETRDRCPIVFGFPNAQSAPGYYRHLGRVELRPFPQLRRPLAGASQRAIAAAGRFFELAGSRGRDRSIEIEPVDDFSGIADPVWEQIAPVVGTAVIRDERFLNWRFVDSPFRYVRLAAFRAGRPVGLAVLAASAAGRRARLMELLVVPAEGAGVLRALVARVVELATSLDADGVGFIATPRHPQWRQLLACGFLPTIDVRRGRPRSTAFGVRVNGPGVARDQVMRLRGWHLSGADQDWH